MNVPAGFMKLLDNYERSTGVTERVTTEELLEISLFLDAVLQTEVMKVHLTSYNQFHLTGLIHFNSSVSSFCCTSCLTPTCSQSRCLRTFRISCCLPPTFGGLRLQLNSRGSLSLPASLSSLLHDVRERRNMYNICVQLWNAALAHSFSGLPKEEHWKNVDVQYLLEERRV